VGKAIAGANAQAGAASAGPEPWLEQNGTPGSARFRLQFAMLISPTRTSIGFAASVSRIH